MTEMSRSLVFNQIQVPAGDLDAVGVIDVLLHAAEVNAPIPSCLDERAALLERLHANRAWLAAR
jgi:hypothetical protein